MGFLAGKRLLITGLLSNRSIAYGIAKACHREGAELAFSYVGERFKERITEFAAEFGSTLVYDCDVGNDAAIEQLFVDLKQAWPEGFDGFVHSIGFAHSFPALAKAALPSLRANSSLLTLSYLGAARYVPAYNTMGLAKASLEASVRYLAASLGPRGIRVNGISAGPIKTLAASGIKGFGKLLDVFAKNAPMRRLVTIEDVGNVAAFLFSDLAGGMTSEITYVDGGFSHVMVGGMPGEGDA